MRTKLAFRPLLELMVFMIGGMILSGLLSQALGLNITSMSSQKEPAKFLIAVALSLIFSFGIPAFLWLKLNNAHVRIDSPKHVGFKIYVSSFVFFVCTLVISNYLLDLFTQVLNVIGWKEFAKEAFNSSSVRELLNNENFIVPVILVIAILPAIVEEFFFRRIIFQYLYRNGNGFWTPAILSALFFSGMHNHLLSFVSIFILGIALAYAFYVTKNIWMSVLLHAAHNTISIFALAYGYEEALSFHWIAVCLAVLPIVFLIRRSLSFIN
jgi:membrane protease YdiL (CAAX protease family)